MGLETPLYIEVHISSAFYTKISPKMPKKKLLYPLKGVPLGVSDSNLWLIQNLMFRFRLSA